MDTTFWGPDGWKLLHLITYNYPSKPSLKMKAKVKNFFNTLPYILPCVYCRNSLAAYFKELPVEKALKNRDTLFKWLFDIHNKINMKLRIQNLNKKNDPSLSKIKNFYKTYTNKNNRSCDDIPGLTFIYSIAFNYPLNKGEFKTKTRFNKHKIFLKLLAELYPFDDFKEKYKKIISASDLNMVLSRRYNFKRWLHNLDKSINSKCASYRDTCDMIEIYRASCKVKTCRKKS